MTDSTDTERVYLLGPHLSGWRTVPKGTTAVSAPVAWVSLSTGDGLDMPRAGAAETVQRASVTYASTGHRRASGEPILAAQGVEVRAHSTREVLPDTADTQGSEQLTRLAEAYEHTLATWTRAVSRGGYSPVDGPLAEQLVEPDRPPIVNVTGVVWRVRSTTACSDAAPGDESQ
ncbi:hypothetical protein [Actinocatenispora rupis]|uniref:Uncharacterized protein n=1 Tax=Actinocatenispora rupis TaxID=519421 RepID=A0A8J3J5W0_9ACTN|nr:hypothetical protein [Actinocatenispora rupis]GID09943.1 hypothetical protein Aru02nite_08320 [Actinocatenispora rupis]